MRPEEFKIDRACPFEPSTPVNDFLAASSEAQSAMFEAIVQGRPEEEIAQLTNTSQLFGRAHKRLVQAQLRALPLIEFS